MSIRINTNSMAMSALRHLSGTQDMLSGSINRLSTGLRINTAADDPAGLIISEGFRSQLNGMSAALDNSQNAVNMVKTAEGAMDEVQKLIRDMRGLAVSSANTAVVDSAQLEANQQQIRSSIDSINRIAQQTQWGQKRLLDGTAGVTTAVTNSNYLSSIYLGGTFGGYSLQTGPVTMTQTSAATAASLTTGKTFANANTVIAQQGTVVLNGYSIVSDGTDTVQSMANKINAIATQTGVVASVVAAGGNVSIKLDNTTPGSQYKIQLTDPSGVLHTSANTALTGLNGVYTVNATTTNGATAVTFTGGQGPGDSGLKLTDGQGNIIVVTPGGNQTWSNVGPPAVGMVTSGSVQFQIGGNANQSVLYAMPNINASNLGTGAVAGLNLSNIDVTTQAGANNAMAVIDAAVQQLSSLRGNLGSFQANYLESNVRALGVTKENLTAAESQIRDADMASEMTRYTQLQVLQQSGMAMLAQANQQPQQILALLKGG